jgi:hypothetical protein
MQIVPCRVLELPVKAVKGPALDKPNDYGVLNLKKLIFGWFDAGATCIGMGSIFSLRVLAAKDWTKLPIM